MAGAVHSFQDTRYGELVVACNEWREAPFERWAFFPGMFFLDREKWWGDKGPRATPHEGIDLCIHTDRGGRAFALGEATRVPAMFDGEIIKIEKDYLGQSVYVGHPIDDGRGRSLCTMYGHTRPADHIRAGTRIRRGDIVATLTERKKKSTGPRPHLHLTMAWISPERASQELEWKTLHDPAIAVLIDPLHAVGGPYTILDPDVSLPYHG